MCVCVSVCLYRERRREVMWCRPTLYLQAVLQRIPVRRRSSQLIFFHPPDLVYIEAHVFRSSSLLSSSIQLVNFISDLSNHLKALSVIEGIIHYVIHGKTVFHTYKSNKIEFKRKLNILKLFLGTLYRLHPGNMLQIQCSERCSSCPTYALKSFLEKRNSATIHQADIWARSPCFRALVTAFS